MQIKKYNKKYQEIKNVLKLNKQVAFYYLLSVLNAGVTLGMYVRYEIVEGQIAGHGHHMYHSR